MDIKLHKISVRDLVDGYIDEGDGSEQGIRGYGGRLDIRPPYQREFVYKDKERNAVIASVLDGFPLNVMYWSDRGDGNYEIIDGQQRTISIARYVANIFSVEFASKPHIFDGLPSDIQSKILDYELMVYFCSGADSEKLDWYKTISIAGKPLSEQEIRNAVYSGPWVTDARASFSKTGCRAYQIGKEYMKGEPINQHYLETVIKWISNAKTSKDIEDYMAIHKHAANAEHLWVYFQEVIDWVKRTFPNKIDLPMKGEDWGQLFNEYKDKPLNPDSIADEALQLDENDEVKRKSGIYRYILTREEKHLSLRAFSKAMKRKMYRKQSGICNICKEHFNIADMEADHITPWSEGGKTIEDNCQMLCRKCNREKASK